MNNDKELNLDDLENISGGQYDPDVEYSKAKVICGGDLYNVNNMREVVGQIQPGQDVELHPDFEYYINGMRLCLIRVNGTDYVTERKNIS